MPDSDLNCWSVVLAGRGKPIDLDYHYVTGMKIVGIVEQL